MRRASTSAPDVSEWRFRSYHRLTCTFQPRSRMRQWYRWIRRHTVTCMSESCHISSDIHAFYRSSMGGRLKMK